MRSSVRRALTACFLLLLAGCASSGDGTRLYVLEPLAQAAPAAAGNPAGEASVVVASVRIPQYLDRPQIVVRNGDHRLQIAEFDQWAGDLREDLTRVLAENLSRVLPSRRVVSAPHALKAAAAFRVEVELLAFERLADGRVRLAARWWLARVGDAVPLEDTRNVELFSAPVAGAAPYDALVAAMGQVYGEFSRNVAGAIRAAQAAKP